MTLEAEPGGAPPPIPPKGISGGQAATLVGAGIGVSRLLGLVRQRVFAFFLGTSDAADAFTAAFRIPNMLQNLLGEGVLSASMIPVYAGLKARGDEDGRREVATAILALLSLVTALTSGEPSSAETSSPARRSSASMSGQVTVRLRSTR